MSGTPAAGHGQGSGVRGGRAEAPWRATVRAHRAAGAALLAALLAATGCGNTEVTLNATPDDAPQTIVLTATAAASGTQAKLSWTTPSEKYSYRVDRNGTGVASLSERTWTDTALAAGQRYCWKVYGLSGFGWQARSNEACLGTDPASKDWRLETLAAGRWPAIAVDASGELHVCWAGVTGTGISYLRVGPGRTPETVDADGQSQCSLAVDANGLVHIAYTSRFGLRHAKREADAWKSATVDAQGLAGGRRFDGPAIALSAAGVPRIAYRRTVSGTVSLAVATRADPASGWTIDPTGIAGLVGPRSLALDPGGASRLAATDELGQSVSAWRRETSGWVRETTQSLAPTAGDGAPIALDATGNARLAWWQRDATSTATAVALKWYETGAPGTTGWVAETVATLDGPGTRVALSVAGGGRRVAVVDAVGTVRLYTRGASAWTGETLPTQGGAAASLDFVVGTDGQLRIVYDRALEGSGSVVLASRKP
ncbi:MAG: hypothetical protein EHM87_22060 [Burkholderiales bacterium]|nr:MAG: hypothetical protein EHM87_22060 [Burkholderiales bacterium]